MSDFFKGYPGREGIPNLSPNEYPASTRTLSFPGVSANIAEC